MKTVCFPSWRATQPLGISNAAAPRSATKRALPSLQRQLCPAGRGMEVLLNSFGASGIRPIVRHDFEGVQAGEREMMGGDQDVAKRAFSVASQRVRVCASSG